jgi:sulfoxide reductase heme-binding subunit YedZ
MTAREPLEFGWWLASRASGVVALVLVSLAVGCGLAMAGRVPNRPALRRSLVAVHEHAALFGLVAIAVHAITLLGDGWLHPGPVGVLVPFAMDHEPLFTGMGVIAAWLAALLGLSFYVRRRIGPALWRRMHRLTALVWLLAVGHTLGAGTDAGSVWLQLLVVATGAPVLFLLLARLLPREKPVRRPAEATS